MLTLSELQDNENNFHIPQPEATRPHLQGECVLTWGGGMRPHLGATRRSLDSVRVSTGLWKCVHWPVETCPLASGNTSTGQWTTAD